MRFNPYVPKNKRSFPYKSSVSELIGSLTFAARTSLRCHLDFSYKSKNVTVKNKKNIFCSK